MVVHFDLISIAKILYLGFVVAAQVCTFGKSVVRKVLSLLGLGLFDGCHY